MRIVGYLFAGYVILSFGGFGLMAGGPTGSFALVLAVAATAALVRSYRHAREPAGTSAPVALGAALPDVAALLRRLERRTGELCERLPADPFASDAFVSVRYALMHEPDAERLAAESEYASRRSALEAVRTAAERLRDDWRDDGVAPVDAAVEARRLEEAVDQVEAYADELDGRARESAEAPDRARETIARAEALLAGAIDPGEAASARETLGAAAAALEQGRERPLTARRLADEALARLEDASERELSERALPGDVDERQAAVAQRQTAVAEALARIRENLALAASRSAPSCVVDIEAGDAAARQLHEQTARAAGAAAERARAGDLRQAAAQLSTALALLDQAEPLVERVEAQLNDLAHTALAAREAVRLAEAATDAAWATLELTGPPDGAAGKSEVVREARRLAERAREKLGEQAPDWFDIRQLSERATRLVHGLDAAPAGGSAVGGDALKAARDAAAAAREEAWAQALSDYADRARAHEAEAAFQKAVALEDEAAQAPSSTATARAVTAFREAEQIARSAAVEAEDTRIRSRPRPGPARQGDPAELVASLAFGALFGAAFGD